ncbi:MAG: hypothetical protein ACLUE1_05730 [Adlercreutzia equolifaciens]
MLKAIEIKPDVFWVGGIDWNERNFHGYTTERGSTYNAYLILDEKITLIDTCKKPFTGELINASAPSWIRLIDYIIVQPGDGSSRPGRRNRSNHYRHRARGIQGLRAH